MVGNNCDPAVNDSSVFGAQTAALLRRTARFGESRPLGPVILQRPALRDKPIHRALYVCVRASVLSDHQQECRIQD